MHKPSEPNSINGIVKPSITTPILTRFKPIPNPKQMDHDAAYMPLQAARGNDEVMSQPPQQSMPGLDEIKGKWKQQIGAAKIVWGKLTEDELLKLEGHQQKLTGLIQERYAITRDQADKQVKSFFEKHLT